MWPRLVLRRLARGLLARSSSDDGVVEKATSLAWVELAIKDGEPAAGAFGCGGYGPLRASEELSDLSGLSGLGAGTGFPEASVYVHFLEAK